MVFIAYISFSWRNFAGWEIGDEVWFKYFENLCEDFEASAFGSIGAGSNLQHRESALKIIEPEIVYTKYILKFTLFEGYFPDVPGLELNFGFGFGLVEGQK